MMPTHTFTGPPTPENANQKRCAGCKRVKVAATNFWRSKTTKSGFQSWCRQCQRINRSLCQSGEDGRPRPKTEVAREIARAADRKWRSRPDVKIKQNAYNRKYNKSFMGKLVNARSRAKRAMVDSHTERGRELARIRWEAADREIKRLKRRRT